MNLYFWLFSFCALLMTPVGVQGHIRIDHGIHYRIRIRAAGLPVLRKKKKEEPDVPLHSGDVMKSMRGWDHGLFVSLLREGHFSRLLRSFKWQDTELRARISFADAAQTAIVYGAVRTVLQAAACIRPFSLRGRVEMDFQGAGTQISLRCIATARLGSLMAAVLRLWAASAAYRAKRSAEEENYAAASH